MNRRCLRGDTPDCFARDARDAGGSQELSPAQLRAPWIKKEEDCNRKKKPARSSEEHVFPDFPHKFIAFQKHACGASVPSCNFGRRAIIANENFLVYRSLGTVEKL